MSDCSSDELSSAACVELAMEILDMIVHSMWRASDAFCDDTDGLALDELVEDGLLALGEPLVGRRVEVGEAVVERGCIESDSRFVDDCRHCFGE